VFGVSFLFFFFFFFFVLDLIISEILNTFMSSHEFKNSFTVEMGLLHLQLFTVFHEQPDK